jgi:SAM-dependent methyltransferase
MESHILTEAEYVVFHQGRIRLTFEAARPFLPARATVGVIGGSPFDRMIAGWYPDWSMRNILLVPRAEVGGSLGVPPGFDGASVPVGGPAGPLAEAFDVVLCTEVIEHILEEDEVLLSTVASLLRPGGLLVFSVPNAAGFGNRVKLLLGRNVHWDKRDLLRGTLGGYGHIREYTVAEVRRLLATDFDLLALRGVGGYRKGLSRALDLLPSTYANTLVAVGRRRTPVPPTPGPVPTPAPSPRGRAEPAVSA